MKQKKENRKKYIILVSIIVVTLLLWVTAYSIKNDRNLTFVERGIKDSVLVIGNILGTPIRYVKDKWELLKNSEEIYENYQQLRSQYPTLEQYEASMQELNEENRRLKNLLELNSSLSSYEKINATVISRNMNYWLNSFTIDKGSSSGIEQYMAVLSDGGFVGYISEVSTYTSTVKMLTNPNLDNKISIKIQISEGVYAYGLLTGYDQEKNVYYVEGISEYVDIPIGANVTTTGFGDRFPGGLLIGTVQDIQTDSFDLAKIVSIKPAMKVDDISFVTILVREGDAT